MKVYIAGPMSGIPDHNFPVFMAAAEAWRAAGWEVVNPAELDGDTPYEELVTMPWDYFLRRDLGYLVQCDAIALLPGWEKSKGARLERHVAAQLGMPILDADFRMSPRQVSWIWQPA
jgi:uncharacterized protein DUF4406